jgi:type IV pilus assembly protein PilX
MKNIACKRRQRGAVLIVSLLFLVILTMLGVTAMTSTTFEERMAGNARDAAVANHAAEAALREARDEILGFTANKRASDPSAFGAPADAARDCVAGICPTRNVPMAEGTWPLTLPDMPSTVDWSDSSASSVAYGFATSDLNKLSGLSKKPRYVIELFCARMAIEGPSQSGACRLYRFTSTGWGRNPNTKVVVQETFLKQKQ